MAAYYCYFNLLFDTDFSNCSQLNSQLVDSLVILSLLLHTDYPQIKTLQKLHFYIVKVKFLHLIRAE